MSSKLGGRSEIYLSLSLSSSSDFSFSARRVTDSSDKDPGGDEDHRNCVVRLLSEIGVPTLPSPSFAIRDRDEHSDKESAAAISLLTISLFSGMADSGNDVKNRRLKLVVWLVVITNRRSKLIVAQ
ncbi:hypothetical protein L484_008651 [Morus notabilis]|uniref:Uncharacterized protein n=1 Tax=Morus notabilis TaxID=981085 RepID=W9RXJ1_9ROSA|nr:hypothetical protein L484_008651 [Morus notabilis]